MLERKPALSKHETESHRADAQLSSFVYILSPSFSGSTLLTFLLAAHPDVSTIGELKATSMGDIENYECSCGTKIRRCSFWQRVTQELARRGVSFDLADFGTQFRNRNSRLTDRLLRARVRTAGFEAVRRVGLRWVPGWYREFSRILERNRILAEVVSELCQASVFLDGSKDPVRLKYLGDAGFWNVRVIYLIRDGRGTANSYVRNQGLTMTEAALEWRRTHEECRHVLSRLPRDTWKQLRYEDLCRNPDETMAGVFGFVGLDAERAERDFRSVEHHILGNSMRLASSSEIVLDEKWRTELTNEHLATFERIAGDLNRRYGYT